MHTHPNKHEPLFVVDDLENQCDYHYANMSVQYTAIFQGCKNDNFQMKIRTALMGRF